MKKILSCVLATICAAQFIICGMSASAAVGETTVMYNISQPQTITTNTRTFGIAAYEIGNKRFAYAWTRTGLIIYDVTVPAAPEKIQEVTSVMNLQSINSGMKRVGNKLYLPAAVSVQTTSNVSFACLEIITTGEDAGKVSVPETGIALSAWPNCYLVDSADDMYAFAMAKGSNDVRIYDASGAAQVSDYVTYTDDNSQIRAFKAHKLDNGIYRMAFVQEVVSGATYELSVVDWDLSKPENQFTKICEEVIPQWKANKFNSKFAFLDDTTVVVPYQEGTADTLYTVNFSNYTDNDSQNDKCEIVSTVNIASNVSKSSYPVELSNGEIGFFNKATNVRNYNSATAGIIGTANFTNPATDIELIGNVNSEEGALVYFADGYNVIIASVKRDSITETSYDNLNVIDKKYIRPEAVNDVSISTRLMTNVTANIGNKTVLYGLGNSNSGIYAFDVTNPQNVTQIGSTVAGNNGGNAEMYVKDGYLIYGNGQNINVNKLNEDGSVGALAGSQTMGGTIYSLKLIDNLLFASSWAGSEAVAVFDVSNPASIKFLATVDTNYTRAIEVEKISNITYRVYISQKADNKGDNNASQTVTLAVKDVTYVFGSVSVKALCNASVPSGTNIGWPGYNGYVQANFGRIYLLKEGYITVETDDSSNGGGRFIIDMTNPVSPVVVSAEKNNHDTYRLRKFVLDNTKTVEVTNNKAENGVKIIDYSDPTAPETIAHITDIKGDGASILNNYLYTTDAAGIHIKKLYDKYVTYGTISFNNNIVSDTDTTASVTVSNSTDDAIPGVIIIAMYDSNNKLNKLEFSKKTIAANETDNITATISADDIPTDTSGIYFKAMLWQSMDNIKPLTGCAILGK